MKTVIALTNKFLGNGYLHATLIIVIVVMFAYALVKMA